MKALVFGGDGYIGRHLKELARSFDEVVLTDRREPVLADIEYVDVRKPIPLGIAGDSPPDWIVLLAAVHREPGHLPSEYFETNLAGARNVATYVEAVNCRNIFFFSSSSVYGPTEEPTDEQSLTRPTSPYGASKLGAELILEGWQKSEPGRRLVICRPGVVYGPRDPGNVLRMIRAIQRGWFVLPGKRTIHKSYAYIFGLIDSLDFTIARSEPLLRYNYVERKTETLGSLVQVVREEFGSRHPVPSLPSSVVVAAAYASQLVTDGRSAAHPVRVRKAAQPTHIVPRWLIENGFEFRFDFRSSLKHWASVSPEDFQFDRSPARRLPGSRTWIADRPIGRQPTRELWLPRAARSSSPEERDPEADVAALRARFPAVAVVHDWLTVPGGSERVLAALFDVFPEAELFTSIYDPAPWPAAIRDRIVHESFLGRLPHARRIYPRLLPLMRSSFRSFDLREFDLVVSSSHAFAKSVVTAPGQLHVCYCHTPLRLLWEPRFLAQESVGPAARATAALARSQLRRLDREDAALLDAVISNSRYTAERVSRHWKRSSTVVHPPVEIGRFAGRERRPGDEYVVLGRVVPYKRVDLAVAACAKLGRAVTVVGDGRALDEARAAAGSGATFTGRVSDEEAASILLRAKAVICCADEDFGIVPVEAQAAGAPVIAYGVGGHRDSVIDGLQGVLFEEQTVDCVAAAIQRFESSEFAPEVLRANAERFSTARFQREIARAISVAAGLANAPTARSEPAPQGLPATNTDAARARSLASKLDQPLA